MEVQNQPFVQKKQINPNRFGSIFYSVWRQFVFLHGIVNFGGVISYRCQTPRFGNSFTDDLFLGAKWCLQAIWYVFPKKKRFWNGKTVVSMHMCIYIDMYICISIWKKIYVKIDGLKVRMRQKFPFFCIPELECPKKTTLNDLEFRSCIFTHWLWIFSIIFAFAVSASITKLYATTITPSLISNKLFWTSGGT